MDETPEQRAIQEKRHALRALERKAAAKRRTGPKGTNALFSRERPPENLARPASPASDRLIGPRLLRLVLSLLLLMVVGLPILVIYGFMSGSIALFGNCGIGPYGFIGEVGHYVGGSAATLPTATWIGVVLLVVAAIAAWLLQRTAIVVFMYAWLYVIALMVLAIIASRIWGPRHCVLY